MSFVGSTVLLRSTSLVKNNGRILIFCVAVHRYANMTLEAGYRTVLSISRASSYGSGWYLPPFCGAFTSLSASYPVHTVPNLNPLENPLEPGCGMAR